MFYLADDSGDVLVTPPELEAQLRNIRKYCDEAGAGEGYGAFVALRRPDWARAREHLLTVSKRNKDTLDLLDRAILMVVLTETSPSTEDDLLREVYAPRDAGSFWCDKGTSLVVTKNGLTGSVNDHAPYDAMVMVSCSFYGDVQVWKDRGKWESMDVVTWAGEPHELLLDLDAASERALQAGQQLWSVNRDAVALHSPLFTGFGRRRLRSFGLHPDTVVQLALQLAYYRIHGAPAATYQTATTRRFYHARTETIRSCTPEAVLWARSLLKEQEQVVTGGSWTPSQTVAELFAAAHKKHNWWRSECEAGRGCDRHLFGEYSPCGFHIDLRLIPQLPFY